MHKTKKGLIILIILFVVFLIFLNFKKPQSSQQEVKTEPSPYVNSQIEITTFQAEKGWGYDIFIDGTQYVHQPNIPALPGDTAFATKEDAKAVAELMVQKIRDNILPPGVTEEEVKAILEK